jgi:uncharacterized protein (TIGR02145 family)
MRKEILFTGLIILIIANLGAQTVTYGAQVWSSKNLNVSRFRNGDLIPEAKTTEQWEKAGKNGQPAWCYYNNDTSMGSKYGKLYNWYAVNDPRGLAPVGWHIAGNAEWGDLVETVFNKVSFGGNGTGGAYGSSLNGNLANFTGFSDLHCSKRSSIGYFDFKENNNASTWWTSSEEIVRVSNFSTVATSRSVFSFNNVGMGNLQDENDGLYVRCVKDYEWEGTYKNADGGVLVISNFISTKDTGTFDYKLTYGGESSCNGIELSGSAKLSSRRKANAGEMPEYPATLEFKGNKITFTPSCCDFMVGQECLMSFDQEFLK